MKVEVLSRELIKPYTSTPRSLREYSISLIDELAPLVNVPTILYYADDLHSTSSRCEQLKRSLSKVLARFYPFAGRYMKDSFMVDCSDQGAEFVEAMVDVRLDDLVGRGKDLKVEMLNHLIPRAIGASGHVTDPLLAVQVSCFACGGWAIGLMTSHKIADMSTTCTFINEWAIAAKRILEGFTEDNFPIMSPMWNSASFFPGKKMSGLPLGSSTEKENSEDHEIVTKVFSFKNRAISRVREKARLDSSRESLPTRVQSVFGIIGKSIIAINAAYTKEYLVIQPVNMRERTIPPISKNQCGNFYLLSTTQVAAGGAGVELHSIVNLLTQTVKREVEKCKMILSVEGQMSVSDGFHELRRILAKPKVAALDFSDWCKFPFYEADFGSGKPVWVSSVNSSVANNVNLYSDKYGEGIEAWVTLNSSDMLKFEQDSSIMEYST
ncbi:hypothetical protein DCAR_0312771 [Daucus carota subsp. sativus]|uniref:Uncharacterized protein n=1 Tax=Daucus carota subsp. sativus TaxID=79200 RepID=A0A166B9Z5_DAUCS|nr:PREDICTED: pelargonidin 3-O-(6-caffeoylglucoside) 5-O-(6-O-malonylglucoside) 4'''-malonyltransferase-like [Daucus carota subsp. sativus]WOG93487.1 hypothetical protein DCAR_0312771 [Daucus carota subsp. sativus]